MHDLGIDYSIVSKCVDNSWDNGEDYRHAKGNSLLQKEVNSFNERGIIVWPAVIINNYTYRGDLIPAKHVFEAICESYDEMPTPCTDYFKTNSDAIGATGTGTMLSIYVAATVIMVLISIFLFCVYKRILKNQLNKEI